MTKPLDQALALALRGLPSFPCSATKAPACPRGFKDATASAAELRALWLRHPGPLVGVPTGAVSGFDALDLDRKHDAARLWWRAHKDQMPRTRVHRTRSGGLHVLFQHAEGLRCSAGKLALGVDVRADGGYIIWWAAAGLSVVLGADIAPWPAWLLDELQPPPPPRTTAVPPMPFAGGDTARRYALGALRNAVQRVAGAAEGQRNDRLNSECFTLGRFIADGSLSATEVADALAVAARTAGLTSRETVSTLASALRAGDGR